MLILLGGTVRKHVEKPLFVASTAIIGEPKTKLPIPIFLPITAMLTNHSPIKYLQL
jgi:hypothetical protein